MPRYVEPPGRVLPAKRDRSARSPHCLEIRGGCDRRRYTLQPSPAPSPFPPRSDHFCSFREPFWPPPDPPPFLLRACPRTHHAPTRSSLVRNLFSSSLERGVSSTSISLMLSPALHALLQPSTKRIDHAATTNLERRQAGIFINFTDSFGMQKLKNSELRNFLWLCAFGRPLFLRLIVARKE